MRRFLVTAVCAVALFGMLAPSVFAQAPAPKVTITGLFDQVTSAGNNFYDGNYARTSDREWYARTRFRPDFEFAVGRTKAVLGLEIDLQYGQAAANDGGFPGNVTGAGGHKGGTNGGLDINTDVGGMLEVKWIYTEFDLTGKDSLLPFIPVQTVARAGGQPFSSLATYKIAYATGDFAGVSAVTTFAPNLKLNIAYVMVEDELAGGNRGTTASLAAAKATRGNDFALIVSPEITPFKGLDIKPLVSYFRAEGLTSGSARRTVTDRGLVGGTTGAAATYAGSVFPAATTAIITSAAGIPAGSLVGVDTVTAVPIANTVTLATPGAASTVATTTTGPASNAYVGGDPTLHENRVTLGVDARWRSGPWGLDPTVYYQVGSRNVQAFIPNTITGTAFTVAETTTFMSAWLVDVIGSYQAGPFLLEVRGIYSTGNDARDNLSKRISYFEPLNLDTGYYSGWSQIWALGVDYFNGGGGSNAGMATNVGYDRYGRAQFGVRGTYNMTPALALYTILSPTWTAKKVDIDTSAARGIVTGTTTNSSRVSFAEGDSSYLGTEWDLGMTWRFAPNTAFDLVGAYLFAGEALGIAENLNGAATRRDARDAWTIASRVRLSF